MQAMDLVAIFCFIAIHLVYQIGEKVLRYGYDFFPIRYAFVFFRAKFILAKHGMTAQNRDLYLSIDLDSLQAYMNYRASGLGGSEISTSSLQEWNIYLLVHLTQIYEISTKMKFESSKERDSYSYLVYLQMKWLQSQIRKQDKLPSK